MSDQTKAEPLGLPRRHFVSVAALFGFLVPSVRAQESDTPPDVLPLPTVADALVDVMSLMRDIERGILYKYYLIIGKLAGQVGNKYFELRSLVNEFQKLVPELKVADVAYLRGLAEIGHVTASSINNSTVQEPFSINKHLALINSTSTDLNSLVVNARWQDGSVTLSPQAAEKLREIFRKVFDLNKPTAQMTDASKMLTDVSNCLRRTVRTAEGHISEAISHIVAAELLEKPSSVRASDTLAATDDRRDKALGKIQEARNAVIGLQQFSPPKEFLDYLEENHLSLDESQLAKQPDVVRVPTLIRMLEGAEKWITEDKKGAQRAGQYKSVRFVNANLSPAIGWYELWTAIRNILGERVPEATKGRTWQLWGRKKLLGWYSKDDQYVYFYELLPNLDPPKKDLSDKDRSEAARSLANL